MANVFTKLFFVEEEKPTEKKKEESKEAKEPVKVEAQSTIPIATDKIVGAVNPKILTVLSETLEKANIEGPDYQELKLGADKMEKAGISDENARYIAAYIGLKAGYPSLNKEHILKSIDYYIEVVNKEKESGLAELEGKRKELVDNKQAEIQSIETNISSFNEEISRLKAKVMEETNKVNKYRNEIVASKRECEQNEADLNATFELVLTKLKNDREKLSLILND